MLDSHQVSSRGWSLTDSQAALAVSTALFALSAWPIGLTEVPPFQDLPNHLATLKVIEYPELYPEFRFNGFLKTNSALFAWLFVVAKLTGVKLAAKLFVIVVLAVNALVLPRFVLALTGSRERMLVSSLFAWPMIHNYFVTMGMLNFALGVSLSLVMILALDRQMRKPSVGNGLLVALLGMLTWYAHVFPLLVVHLLASIEVFRQRSWKERFATARALFVPLAPITFFVLVSLGQHIRAAAGPMTAGLNQVEPETAWELTFNMWAHWLWGFSHFESSTLVPAIGLVLIGIWRRKESPPFFSSWALLALGALYCFFPSIIANWFLVNSRLIPYISIAFLLRVPPTLPKSAIAVLGLSAALYTIGLGIDYVRLERERRELTAGIQAVPEGARLLPLLFSSNSPGDNTRHLLHAWGYYVSERRTGAPLLFAHSRSFPVTYSVPPPKRFNHLVLENFVPAMATPETMCRRLLDKKIFIDDCDGVFRATWSEFYRDALPRYDHLLLWDAPLEGRAVVPSGYRLAFERGRLAIYERENATEVAQTRAP